MAIKRKAASRRSVALKHGYRSGLEEQTAEELQLQGINYAYEKLVIPYEQPAKRRKYTPDFHILDNGIIIETKGRFLTADRQKHLAVSAQYPELDLRFVFSNPNQRISKQSQTTYAAWCSSKGFLYAAVSIPKSWLREPPNRASMRIIQELMDEASKENKRGRGRD